MSSSASSTPSAPAARATATIQVRPTVEGLITATAIAAATQMIPSSANNVASVTTAVGPAADLLLTAVDVPDPVVQQGLLDLPPHHLQPGPQHRFRPHPQRHSARLHYRQFQFRQPGLPLRLRHGPLR